MLVILAVVLVTAWGYLASTPGHPFLILLIVASAFLLGAFLIVLFRTVRRLRLQEQRAALLAQTPHDFLLGIAPTPDLMAAPIIEVSPSTAARLGRTVDALCSFTLGEVLALEGQQPFHTLADMLQEAETVTVESVLLTADHQYLPVAFTVARLPAEEEPILLLLGRDLSGMRRAEEVVQRTEEALRALTEVSPLPLIGLDVARRVTRWSSAAEGLFLWRADEVLGQSLPILTPKIAPAFDQAWAATLSAAPEPVTLSLLRKDGVSVLVSATLSPTRDAEGRVSGMMLVLEAVAQRMEAEAELRRTTRTLHMISGCLHVLAQASEESELLHSICRVLAETPGYRFAWIGLPQQDIAKSVRPVAWDGISGGFLDACTFSWATQGPANPIGIAVAVAQPASVRHLPTVPHKPAWMLTALTRGFSAMIALPLTAWWPHGVLVICSEDPDAFDEEEVELLTELARDVTFGVETLRMRAERVLAEGAVLTAAQHWRATFDAISEPVCVVDWEGRIQRCNLSFAQWCGKPFDALLGTMLLGGSTPAPAPADLLIRMRETYQTVTEVVQREDRWYQVKIDPLRDEEGRLLGGIYVMDDITKRMLAEEALTRNLTRIRTTLNSTIAAIAKIVEMRDPYTAGHEQRVSELATAIARELELPEDRVEGLRVAAMLHDIGKLYIPAEILSKSGRLSDHEFGLVRSHAQAGYDILHTIEFPWPVAEIAYQHHERLDGTGYPRALQGEAILLEARILAVADVVESMASHRPYRPAFGLQASLAEIQGKAGMFYDAEVVAACVRLFTERGYTLEGIEGLQPPRAVTTR